MTLRQHAASAFVNLYLFLCESIGRAAALVDSRLQLSRREYCECL